MEAVGVLRRLRGEQLGAEEAGLDEHRADPERRDLGGQRLHPALHAELGGGVGGAELLAHDAGGRGDRDEQAGALGAHDRKGRAGDVDRAEQGGLDLRPEVLGGDLLEEPGVEVARVVDQHVDAAEPVDGAWTAASASAGSVTSSLTARPAGPTGWDRLLGEINRTVSAARHDGAERLAPHLLAAYRRRGAPPCRTAPAHRILDHTEERRPITSLLNRFGRHLLTSGSLSTIGPSPVSYKRSSPSSLSSRSDTSNASSAPSSSSFNQQIQHADQARSSRRKAIDGPTAASVRGGHGRQRVPLQPRGAEGGRAPP